MARTKAQTRKYIDRIMAIKVEVDVLATEKRAIAKKLGLGTWRSINFPGLAVIAATGSGGWRVSWKEVALAFAKKLGMNDSQIREATHGHRTMTYAYPTVYVKKDTANWSNPKLAVF